MNFRKALILATPDFIWQTKREIHELVNRLVAEPYSYVSFQRQFRREINHGIFVSRQAPGTLSKLKTKQFLRCRENPIDSNSSFSELL